jgi:hypothetical protein
MTILYPVSTPVKSRRFGRGILPYVPSVRTTFEPSESDRLWLAQNDRQELEAARREAELNLDRRYDAEFERIDDGRYTDADAMLCGAVG